MVFLFDRKFLGGKSGKEKILATLAEKESALRSILTTEQKEQYENCEKHLLELYSLSEKDAFIKGVCFATKFLTEAWFL